MSDNPVQSQQAVVLERSFDAPIDLIWRLWTDPEHFKAWYGPKGATIPFAKMDVRVGGTRLVCLEMTFANGPMQMWFAGEYLEVVEFERLVYTEFISNELGDRPAPSGTGRADSPLTTEVRIEFVDLGGRTKQVLTHTGIPAESPGATGWMMALDKLAALVAAT